MLTCFFSTLINLPVPPQHFARGDIFDHTALFTERPLYLYSSREDHLKEDSFRSSRQTSYEKESVAEKESVVEKERVVSHETHSADNDLLLDLSRCDLSSFFQVARNLSQAFYFHFYFLL